MQPQKSAQDKQDKIYQRKLQKFQAQQGILKKKSKVLGFQERHFAIRDHGSLLVYYKKNQQSSQDGVPQGSIYIGGIDIDERLDHPTEFVISIQQRNFFLRSNNALDKKNWISALKFLKEYLSQQKDFEDRQKQIEDVGQQHNYWKKIDSETLTRIKLEDEKLHVDEKMGAQKEISSQLMDIKGISEYTDQIDNCLLQDRMLSGILWKKKDGNLLAGQAKQRWFFLLTKYSLYSDDKEIIDTKLLPDWLQFNTLYYYTFDPENLENDTSKRQGMIKADQILKVAQHQIKHKDQNFLQKGFKTVGDTLKKDSFNYGFELQIYHQKEEKNVTYHFYSEFLTEINQWVEAINKIMDEEKREKEKKENPEKESSEEYSDEGSDIEGENGGSGNDFDSISSSTSEDSNIFDQINEQFRNQIIKEGELKQENAKKKKKNVYMQLKRQIINVFPNSKKIENDCEYMTIKDIKTIDGTQDKKLILTDKNDTTWTFHLKKQEERDVWLHLIKQLKENDEIQTNDLFQNYPKELEEFKVLNPEANDDKNNQNFDDFDENDTENPRQLSVYSQYLTLKKKMENPDFKPQTSEQFREEFQKKEKKESFFAKIFCCCCRKKPKKKGKKKAKKQKNLENIKLKQNQQNLNVPLLQKDTLDDQGDEESEPAITERTETEQSEIEKEKAEEVQVEVEGEGEK